MSISMKWSDLHESIYIGHHIDGQIATKLDKILENDFSPCMVDEASNKWLFSPFYLFFLYQVVLKNKEIQQIVISPIIFPKGANEIYQ